MDWIQPINIPSPHLGRNSTKVEPITTAEALMANHLSNSSKLRNAETDKQLYLAACEPSLQRPTNFNIRPILWNLQSSSPETKVHGLSDALKSIACLKDAEVSEIWSQMKSCISIENDVIVRFYAFEVFKSICLRPYLHSSLILELLDECGDPGDISHEAQLMPIDLRDVDPRDVGHPEVEHLGEVSLLPLLQRLLLIVHLEISLVKESQKEKSKDNFHLLCEYTTSYITTFNRYLTIVELESITLNVAEISKGNKSVRQSQDIINFFTHLYPRSLESPTILTAILMALSGMPIRSPRLSELAIAAVRPLVQGNPAEVESQLFAIILENDGTVDLEQVAGAIEIYNCLLAEDANPLCQSISLPKIVNMMEAAQRCQDITIDRRLLQLCIVLMKQRNIQRILSEDWSEWGRLIETLVGRCQREALYGKSNASVQDDIVAYTLNIPNNGKRLTADDMNVEASTASDLLNLVLGFYSALQKISSQKLWLDLDFEHQNPMLRTFSVLDYRLFSSTYCHNLIRTFLRFLNDSLKTSLIILDKLIAIAKSPLCETDARLIALKLLLRIRCDSSSALWVLPGSESEILAAVLKRTVESAELFGMQQDRAREFAGSDAATSTSLNRPTPPMWMYGGRQGLPETPPASPSSVTFSSGSNAVLGDGTFKAKLWLEFIIERLQNEENWEIYSYIVVHAGAQLMNVTLFQAAEPQVRFLRSILIEQITGSTYHEPPSETGLKKSDVAICIFNILTSLISYHPLFETREVDSLVHCFSGGIGTLEGTSKGCLQALSICCVELPRSVTACLDVILDRISKTVTQSALAMHVLEFLVNLARLSDIYYNFGDEDIRTLFGICFKYLEIAREDKDRNHQSLRSRSTGRPSTLPSGPAVEDTESLDRKSRDPTNEFPQYILALTYHVMIHWYLAINVTDRSKHSSFILKRLMHRDSSTNEVFEEQTRVFIDMMQRTCGSDLGETEYPDNFFQASDGLVVTEAWMVGTCLMMVDTGSYSGRSIITKRFPTSTSHVVIAPNPQPLPRHHVPIRAPILPESAGTSSQLRVSPVHLFLLSSTLNAPVPGVPLSAQPMRLDLGDASVKRAISMFDRNNTVDGHRVGIIYISPETVTEQQILSNTMVSEEFLSFLDGLGTLCPFDGTYFKTQGFDETTDGAATYAWRDRISEMIFHVTSMMPTNTEVDPQCNSKKRHVGNDHIKVFFNESGQEVDFDIIGSQFNSVNIVVSPATRLSAAHCASRALIDHVEFVKLHIGEARESTPALGSIKELRSSNSAERISMFKVHTLTASHLATLSPFSSPKVVSAEALPDLIRFTALNASLYSTVARHVEDNPSPTEPYPSAWRERYRALVRLRDKISKELTQASKPPDKPKSPPRSSMGALFRSTPRTSQRGSGQPRADRRTWWYEGKNPRERPEVDHETASPGSTETMLDWVDFGTYTAYRGISDDGSRRIMPFLSEALGDTLQS